MVALLDIASDVVKKAQAQGADAVDAVLFDHANMSFSQRLGNPETVERAESQSLGLRVLVNAKEGYRQAVVSTSDFSQKTLEEHIDRVVTMAKVAPVDQYAALAPVEYLADTLPELDLYQEELPIETLKQFAAQAEEAALAVEGITNSDGADASFDHNQVALVTSSGFAQCYDSSSVSVSTSVIAGKDDKMETDYEYSVARHREDLKDPAWIGKKAAERAVARLNPKKVSTCQVPMVFDPRIARGLLGTFASAINGSAVARGTSFLKEEMGKQLFAKDVTIIDDPYIPRGLGSRPFDAEGVRGEKRALIEEGALTSWLLSMRSANQLGLTTTGHASRGVSSPPGASSSNLYLEKGAVSPKQLMADIKEGLYVTEAFGMGVNTVTGDYSQGASGFWIENGVLTYPVSEVTIAGHLRDMFGSLVAADDLEFISSTNAPTVRIEGMTLAGV